MTASITRARDQRTDATRRRSGGTPPRPRGGGRPPTDGANALAYDLIEVEPIVEAPRPVSTAERAVDRAQRAAPTVRLAPLPMAIPRAPFVALVLAVVVAGVLGILVLNTRINENAFRLDQLRTDQEALNLHEQQLAQQLAELESTGNLMAEALRRKLVPAANPGYIGPDGRVVGAPVPASRSGDAGR